MKRRFLPISSAVVAIRHGRCTFARAEIEDAFSRAGRVDGLVDRPHHIFQGDGPRRCVGPGWADHEWESLDQALEDLKR